MAKLKNWHKGNTKHPLYNTWIGMINRCKYKTAINYVNYGGRGIVVCDRWQGVDGFWNFVNDMGPKPTALHTLDRRETNGNYEPLNCRWATRKEQMATARPRGDNSRNTSGVRGLHFDVNKQKWRGAKMVSGQRLFTKHFKDRELALAALKELK